MPKQSKPTDASLFASFQKDLKKDQDEDPILAVLQSADSRSNQYLNQQVKDEELFIKTLIDHNESVYAKMFDTKQHGFPLFFHLVSDNNLVVSKEDRAKMFSDATKTFILYVKNQRDGKPLEPSTTSTFLRRFLSYCKTRYNINFSIADDFKFAGGFHFHIPKCILLPFMIC
jgi:hypothetical protein